MHETEFKSQGGSDFFYFIAKKDYFLIVVKVIDSHCSKSSFFVQKFNFDFPRKLSIILVEKLVKMLWFWTL